MYLLSPNLIEKVDGYCLFEIYDCCNGNFLYKVKVAERLYEVEETKIRLDHPRYVLMSESLEDVPMMQDFLGVVNEARHILRANSIFVFPSDISVPESLIGIVAPTIAPLTLDPGPMEGYFILRMDPEVPPATFTARSNPTDDMEKDNWEYDDQEQALNPQEEEDDQVLIDRLTESLAAPGLTTTTASPTSTTTPVAISTMTAPIAVTSTIPTAIPIVTTSASAHVATTTATRPAIAIPTTTTPTTAFNAASTSITPICAAVDYVDNIGSSSQSKGKKRVSAEPLSSSKKKKGTSKHLAIADFFKRLDRGKHK
jgi:hypothetical protein